MYNTWTSFAKQKKRLIIFIAFAVISISVVACFSRFLIWNETRPAGYPFHDPILSLFEPINVSWLTCLLTLVPIFFSLIYIFRKPDSSVYFFFAIMIISVLRAFTLYSIVLTPPEKIIPLTDPVIEALFYGGGVLLKDLFFSGHTANIVLVALLTDVIWVKRFLLICAGLVGSLLMIQHVHYSIDVFAAPFFAIATYKISVFLGNRFLLKDMAESLRCGTIRLELGFVK